MPKIEKHDLKIKPRRQGKYRMYNWLKLTITANGSGFTIEAAKQSALRSATEQAFGAFLSSRIEMFFPFC
jgi:hypothetical protein